MTGRWRHALLTAVLLAAPLVVLTAWVVYGAIHETHGASVTPAPGATPAPSQPAAILPGFPAPEADLGADRLEEQVDGGAEYLRAQGCRRLLYWRLAAPQTDLEILVFDEPAGAAAVMARDAGPERQAGPGDEAQVSPQAIFFRRGRNLVRLLADPGATSDAPSLARRAAEVDRALASRPDLPASAGASRQASGL